MHIGIVGLIAFSVSFWTLTLFDDIIQCPHLYQLFLTYHTLPLPFFCKSAFFMAQLLDALFVVLLKRKLSILILDMPELQIRGGIEDNSEIIFLIS